MQPIPCRCQPLTDLFCLNAMIDMLRVMPSKERIIDLLFLTCIATLALTHSVTSLDAAEVDFSKDVLPILANKCFVCHGPDDHPETDLKLDNLGAASEDRGGYQAINQELSLIHI